MSKRLLFQKCTSSSAACSSAASVEVSTVWKDLAVLVSKPAEVDAMELSTSST